MKTICLIPGDGVGAEVVPAAAEVLKALCPNLAFTEAEAGFACFEKHGSALPESTLTAARAADAVLFGATSSPSTIVQGYRSPILALRKEFDLYANLRPVFSLPGEFSRSGIDMLIVRENTEGLYSGREHRDGDTAIAERVITKTGSERIVRVACKQAMKRSELRGKPPVLTVVHKANVLKLTDGLFRECALRVAAEFPEIKVKELLVDSAAMTLVKAPESIDVLVTTNLFGDILSDEASALVGGLGIAPSANVGTGTPVFEPVHGSAPDIAGKGIADPVGTLLSSAMLLETLDEPAAADRLRQAVLDTLASGLRTADLGGQATTKQFTQAVLDRVQ
ncbi:MAG TPA: isocitrate/isopropylmalate dehydrogenase family protein [Anaerolineales bacterium]|nr:isocitrate/isopropylmalate dehydrogenase family protein [Anaerolineales bacterium]